jgi:hypothetical protein
MPSRVPPAQAMAGRGIGVSDPALLLVLWPYQGIAELSPDKSLMVVGCRINQIAEDFLPDPFSLSSTSNCFCFHNLPEMNRRLRCLQPKLPCLLVHPSPSLVALTFHYEPALGGSLASAPTPDSAVLFPELQNEG